MKLCETDYSILYPKRQLAEYELHIRQGRQIARESKVLIYSRGKLDPYALQWTQELWLYSEHRGNINSDLLKGFDYCICLDYRVKWWANDGILNSLGWMSQNKWTILTGVISGQLLGKRKIFNYPVFDSQYQGEKFHWDVGDTPMKVKNWNNSYTIYDLKNMNNEVYFNPSMIALV